MKILGYTITKADTKVLENKLNQILYQNTNNTVYLPDSNNETYIEKGYKGNLQVYSVVSAITRRCTGMSFKHVFKDNEIVNSDLIKLLNKPNSEQSKDEFIEASASWLLLTGNLYWYTIKNDNGLNKGKVHEMWCLPSHLVEIQGGGVMTPVKSYKINMGYGLTIPIEAENVIHIKYFNPSYNTNGEHLYGLSPLQAAIQSFSTTSSGYTALNKSYQNGAPAGILTGSSDTGLEYDKVQMQTLVDAYARQTGGADKLRKLLFSKNPLQFIKLGWSPIDMDILEHLKFSMQDMCNVYQAPIHLFNAQAATLDNYKEARRAIYTDCVLPIFDRLVPIINNQLCPAYQVGSNIIYDISTITELNTDKSVQAQSLSTAWWLTGNERRLVMGLDPHPDPMMDEILYPVQFAPGVDTPTI